MYHSFLIHSSADAHLCCFHILAIIKQCCDKHWGTHVSFRSGFLCVYAQEWDCWVIWQFYFQFFKCSAVVQVPGREKRLLETMQLAIGEFITDSSQGLLPSPRVWRQRAPSPSSLRYLLGTIISWCKSIGYTVARQFLLARSGAFSFPLIGSLFSC